MIDKIFKLKESVDVYVFPEKGNLIKIQFYKINTREKITIDCSNDLMEFIKLLDGTKKIKDLLKLLTGIIDLLEINELMCFLIKKGLAVEVVESQNDISYNYDFKRYARQINYFDDLLVDYSGNQTQIKLLKKRVAIIGCGSIGSNIAQILARSGVQDFILIDYKNCTESNSSRHIFYKVGNTELKVEALKSYLLLINSKVNVELINKKILPRTNLDDLKLNGVDIVINTADEPYIGHISVKLGSYLWDKNIALYVAGGFDAHLMSSGELIKKNMTPCIECCSNSFKIALKDWKPTYISPTNFINNTKSGNFLMSNWSSGIFPQSLYSASLACMNIIDFLIGRNISRLNSRSEFITESYKHSWFIINKIPGCKNCDVK